MLPDIHIIIESVNSISRDGPDMPYNYVIHYKKVNNSEQIKAKILNFHIRDLHPNTYLSSPNRPWKQFEPAV